MNKRFLLGFMSVLFAGALFAAPASATPRLWTNSTETTLLRSVTTEPKNQPDALEFVGEIQKLKLSQNREGNFCTLSLAGVKGEIINPLGGFVEESPPNLEAKFSSGGIPVTCGKAKTKEIFSASFTLETPSTTTDTAWI